mgnify:CR=1 FL=1
MPTLYSRILETPIGPMTAVSLSRDAARTPDGAALVCLEFGHRIGDALDGLLRLAEVDEAPRAAAPGDCPVLDAVEVQLAAYFAGEGRSFDVPIRTFGTAFQRRVWDELGRIPYGQTISYGELARRVGSDGGARAVGAANGDNRISIVIPCHRVVASDGSLHGYGGGLEAKQRLLELEGALDAAPLFSPTGR